MKHQNITSERLDKEPPEKETSLEFTFKPTERPNEYIAIKANGQRKTFRGIRSECYVAAAVWSRMRTALPEQRTKAPDEWLDPNFQPQPDDENDEH